MYLVCFLDINQVIIFRGFKQREAIKDQSKTVSRPVCGFAPRIQSDVHVKDVIFQSLSKSGERWFLPWWPPFKRGGNYSDSLR